MQEKIIKLNLTTIISITTLIIAFGGYLYSRDVRISLNEQTIQGLINNVSDLKATESHRQDRIENKLDDLSLSIRNIYELIIKQKN